MVECDRQRGPHIPWGPFVILAATWGRDVLSCCPAVGSITGHCSEPGTEIPTPNPCTAQQGISIHENFRWSVREQSICHPALSLQSSSHYRLKYSLATACDYVLTFRSESWLHSRSWYQRVGWGPPQVTSQLVTCWLVTFLGSDLSLSKSCGLECELYKGQIFVCVVCSCISGVWHREGAWEASINVCWVHGWMGVPGSRNQWVSLWKAIAKTVLNEGIPKLSASFYFKLNFNLIVSA